MIRETSVGALSNRPPRSRYIQVENAGLEDDPLATAAEQQSHEVVDARHFPMATEVVGPQSPLATSPVNINNIPIAATIDATSPRVVEDEPYVMVKTVDDSTFRISYPRGTTLRDFRPLVEAATTIPATHQKLIVNGRLLSDEDSIIDLPNGTYLHVVVSSTNRQVGRRESDGSDHEGDEFAEFMSETVVQRQMSHLHALAWVVIVVFTLFAWRLLMTLAFDDDTDHNPFDTNLARFLLACFGVYVGWFGVNIVSYHRTWPLERTRKHVRFYILLLSILAVGYLMSTLQSVDFDKNAFFGILIIQSTFWYCILQAQMTNRALAFQQQAASVAPSMTTSAPATATAVAVTPVATQPQASVMTIDNNNRVIEMRPVGVAIAQPVPDDIEAQQPRIHSST